ncbi:MAG: MFS transporter [Burkholderiales bacterium]|jgi:MFS family permease
MLQTVASVSALFLSLVLLTGGSTMLGTLLGLRLELEGFSAARTGLVLAFHAVGFVLGSIYSERIIRRVGHIRAFAVFGALASAAILAHPMYVNAELWIALRLIVGFSIAGLLLIVESWVNGVATARTRGALLSIYMVLFYLASAGGQLMIGLGNPAQFYLFSVSAILVALSLVPLSLTQSVAPQLPEATRVGVREVWDNAPLAMAGASLSGVAMSAFNTMGPIYAARIGLDTATLSVFMGVAIISAMLFQWPVGKMSDHLARNRVVLGLALSGLGASALTAFWGDWSNWLLFASAALYVGFASTVYPVSLALAHDRMQHGEVVGTNATLLLAFGAGTIAGPLGASLTIWLVGPPGLFIFTAAVMGTLGMIATHYWKTRGQIPVAEQEHFVAVTPISTAALMELDPRDETYEQREEAAREHSIEDAAHHGRHAEDTREL